MLSSMNRIAETVQRETGLTKAESMQALDAVILAIRTSLMRCEVVAVDGLGIFRVNVRESARWNSRGSLRASVRFLAGQSLKAAVTRSVINAKNAPMREVKTVKKAVSNPDAIPVSRWASKVPEEEVTTKAADDKDSSPASAAL